MQWRRWLGVIVSELMVALYTCRRLVTAASKLIIRWKLPRQDQRRHQRQGYMNCNVPHEYSGQTLLQQNNVTKWTLYTKEPGESGQLTIRFMHYTILRHGDILGHINPNYTNNSANDFRVYCRVYALSFGFLHERDMVDILPPVIFLAIMLLMYMNPLM